MSEHEPARNALPNGNGNQNSGQPHESSQENHTPAGIPIEEIQPDINHILELDDLLSPFLASPNFEGSLQNVELVENNGFFMIDPLLSPGIIVPEDAHENDEDANEDDGDEDDNNDDDVWPKEDVISHSYANSLASNIDTENSVLRPNQEAKVQIHGGGENKVLSQAENGHVCPKQ